ncbi:MAG: hypothetical protein ACP5G2_01635 [Candidatus Bipolaricaulaceae bacterium]
MAWGVAATLKTVVHEIGHCVAAWAAGADRAWVVSVVPFAGRAAWRWPDPPTLGQRMQACGGGMALCRGLAELTGRWHGVVAEKLQWLLRLDPFLYVLRSLAGQLGILPRLAGDDVAHIVGLLADAALAGRAYPPEELARRKRVLEDTFYGGALLVISVDLLTAWAGGWGPFSELSWEVQF